MYHEHDFWLWSKPFLEPDVIKDINKTVSERYYKVEKKDMGAKSKDGKYLKNIEPKNIYLRDLPETLLDVLHMGFHVCHHSFGLTTFPLNRWDTLLHNVYSSDVQGHYGEHSDESRNLLWDSKMTMLINLSEGEYEGGDLIVNKTVTDFRTPGSIIVFKSYLPHEVTPVTKGERISLTYFIKGPKST